jgi:hypothetical protein
VDGTLGPGSLIQNVWFEHTKVGVWTIGAESALIVGCRMRDTFADGVNLTNGTRATLVEQNHVRNTGDDALAMWATGSATEGNRYRFNTVRLPMLANGIAIYGGNDNSIEDNDIADTVYASAGIAISTRAEFSPLPFGGETRVVRNTLLRTGGYEANWVAEFGGLWVFTNGSAITSGLFVRDLSVVDSTYQGLLLSGEQSISNALFERVSVDGAGSFGIEIAAPGAATFRDVSVSAAEAGGAPSATPLPSPRKATSRAFDQPRRYRAAAARASIVADRGVGYRPAAWIMLSSGTPQATPSAGQYSSPSKPLWPSSA